jgi:hypothetical protein
MYGFELDQNTPEQDQFEESEKACQDLTKKLVDDLDDFPSQNQKGSKKLAKIRQPNAIKKTPTKGKNFLDKGKNNRNQDK